MDDDRWNLFFSHDDTDGFINAVADASVVQFGEDADDEITNGSALIATEESAWYYKSVHGYAGTLPCSISCCYWL